MEYIVNIIMYNICLQCDELILEFRLKEIDFIFSDNISNMINSDGRKIWKTQQFLCMILY